jgi:death-on-curing protein
MAEGDGGQVKQHVEELVGLIERAHELIIRTSGGVHGVHASSLSAAVARPFQSAFGEFIYKTPVERAAALFHAIISDHVFVDGNKRTATFTAAFYLEATGFLPS